MSRIESPDNRVLQEDLERAAALALPIEALDGSRIFVTGATGLAHSSLSFCCAATVSAIAIRQSLSLRAVKKKR